MCVATRPVLGAARVNARVGSQLRHHAREVCFDSLLAQFVALETSAGCRAGAFWAPVQV